MITGAPRGVKDLLPKQTKQWHKVEAVIRQITREYGFEEIRTPIFEHSEVFHRGVGETTDIVQKETYDFTDRGGRELTLRPEGTAPTVRALLEHKLYAGPLPVKLYYVGPMFRFGRPQAGRLRQFHQFGIEVFGSASARVDAEVMAMAMDFYGRLGLTDLELLLNSIGCPTCRPGHREALQQFLAPKVGELCSDCQKRFEKNPMRILDCKNERCQELSQGAPTTVEYLCTDCADHFNEVKTLLDSAGVTYTLDDRLVRGLDYYTKTAFEIVSRQIGAQSSIGGGGRYDQLVETLGGPTTPGIGFGLGLERVLLTMENQGLLADDDQEQRDLFIATAGAGTAAVAFRLMQELRQRGMTVEMDYQGRSLKAQMKTADRFHVPRVMIIGESELAQGVVVLRTMSTSEQQTVPLDSVIAHLCGTAEPPMSV
ncbi:histidine--tRNA ligase [Heliophilum fasciatum]|uniref:Histidine--tRNA ligase n=1 Tax=Heliophilum fasciatum TaxID=35700 RepID=A0A4R2RYZ3_9FIRM|nr:histidine--tRNA ligase [Heliophilum fasciatum]MCW2278055.1 histidyl-tRNA synthetase [Heliophilum fasciatum]TCP64325.1 histidyl-tRNA synthetase [Heliophilum fasciatum]